MSFPGLPVLVLTIGVACSLAAAENDTLVDLLDSPVKHDPLHYGVGEAIHCSLNLPSSAALFGTDYDPNTGRFIVNEMFSPFRVFAFDEDCALFFSWTTIGIAGTSATGVAFPNSTGTRYWAADPANGMISEHVFGTGTPTGVTVATMPGVTPGPLVVDVNQPGEVMCIGDPVLDAYFCVDLNAGGALLCSYLNPDDQGGGAFGNGISEAVAPADCGGHTLVHATGTLTEGQVIRAGQYDCSGFDVGCTDRWDFRMLGPTAFINGICEFGAISGARDLMCVDNATSSVLRLAQPFGIFDCQGIDSDMNILFVNGSQGGIFDFVVEASAEGQLAVGVQRTPFGDGRFVYHMNAGAPSPSTVASVRDLGNGCFPFLGGSPVVVENNVGRPGLLGASNYFGAPIANPAKAPLFLPSLLQPVVDSVNLPAGSKFTSQLIALNGAASSETGGSLSNAVILSLR